ncbi:MAG: hypothetical protein AAFO29_22710, partial [Actinomycetota bacterium]
MFEKTTRRWLPAALGACLLLGACSDGDDEAAAEVATLQAVETGGAAADAAVRTGDGLEDLDPDEAALEFSQCMRDEGLDFPDLSVDAEGNIELREAFQTVDRQSEGFQEAFDGCGEILQATGFGGGRREAQESPEFQDALIEFSACVRDEGYDVGDLTLGGQGPGGNAGGADDAAGDDTIDGADDPAEGADEAGAGGGQRGQRAEGFGD